MAMLLTTFTKPLRRATWYRSSRCGRPSKLLIIVDRNLYRLRNLVERGFIWLKSARRIAIRCGKRPKAYSGSSTSSRFALCYLFLRLTWRKLLNRIVEGGALPLKSIRFSQK